MIKYGIRFASAGQRKTRNCRANPSKWRQSLAVFTISACYATLGVTALYFGGPEALIVGACYLTLSVLVTQVHKNG